MGRMFPFCSHSKSGHGSPTCAEWLWVQLRWYYQAVPNDFEDHDIQASSIAAVVGGVPSIIGGGKMGIVYAMNARPAR
jgi:hypothetical protein